MTLKMSFYSTQAYDQQSFQHAFAHRHPQLPVTPIFHQEALGIDTVCLAQSSKLICAFVNDRLDAPVLQALAGCGVEAVMLRCAGFDHVDLSCARQLNIRVARVPVYSPQAVSEHAIALLMTLNRRIHLAYNRVRNGNFLLNGLEGTNINGKTVGIVGLGHIGLSVAKIFKGFGAHVIGTDVVTNPQFQHYGEQVDLATILTRSDIISLHCPLTEQTHHLINSRSLAQTKKGVIIINTSRGGLIDVAAVIDALKSGHLGGLALDVYENEKRIFFNDHSLHSIKDDQFVRLVNFPNVLVTGHQAFLTDTALENIAETTLDNVYDYLNSDFESANWCLPSRVAA